jgi:hypothetical protein
VVFEGRASKPTTTDWLLVAKEEVWLDKLEELFASELLVEGSGGGLDELEPPPQAANSKQATNPKSTLRTELPIFTSFLLIAL